VKPRIVAIVALAAFVLPDSHAVQSSENSTRQEEIARIIANLAKDGVVVDIQTLRQVFKIPDLQDKLTWHGPFSGAELPSFDAWYAPVESELGIERLVITWRVVPSPQNGSPKLFHSLRISLGSDWCPSEALLTEAIGSKLSETRMPGYDGGPSYTVRSLVVQQPTGEPVTVLVKRNPCTVTISRTRSL
jgi:hypothetical protein